MIKQSPGYSPNAPPGATPNSPNYSPMMQHGGNSVIAGLPMSGRTGNNSPAYSPSVKPTGMYSVNSPNYSP